MFSIVIPLYNKAFTISNTLQTVVNQTFRDFEVIVVDDGSTDNSAEIIRKNFTDPRIRIIHQENSGVSAARNRGVREAKYDYVGFIDADDEWLPTYMETMREIIAQYPEANMMCAAGFSKNFKTGVVSTGSIIEKYVDKTLPLNYFINPTKMGHIGATIIRKTVFLKVGGFPENISNCEDMCLIMRVAMEGLFIYCGKLLHVYVYNVQGQATSQMCDMKAIKNETFVVNDIFERWLRKSERNPLVPVFLKYFTRHFFFTNLKWKKYENIELLINHLSIGFKELLGSFFIRNVNKRKLRLFFILYLGITKVIWRMHGFPPNGKPIKSEKKLIDRYYREAK